MKMNKIIKVIMLMLMVLMSFVSVNAITEYEEFVTGTANGIWDYSALSQTAITFTPTQDYTLTRVDLTFAGFQHNKITTIDLYSTSAGVPTTLLTTLTSLNQNTMVLYTATSGLGTNTSNMWKELNVNHYDLTAGTTYAIKTSDGDTVQDFYIGDSFGAPNPNSQLFSGITSWSLTTTDGYYRLWGEPIILLNPKIDRKGGV